MKIIGVPRVWSDVGVCLCETGLGNLDTDIIFQCLRFSLRAFPALFLFRAIVYSVLHVMRFSCLYMFPWGIL